MHNESTDVDEDVVRECISMRVADDAEMTLSVRELYKYYGNFCAVKNLTFGIRQTDCFGLLGIKVFFLNKSCLNFYRCQWSW